MSDPVDTVRRLLSLAGDPAASDNERVASATKAARLFREHALRLSAPDDDKRLTCIMCQPADRGLGTCPRCGLVCPGPGHPCSDPEPGSLCAAHATWRVRRPPPAPPAGFGFPYPPSAPASFGFAPIPILKNVREIDLFTQLGEVRADLARARARIAELEAEIARRESADEDEGPTSEQRVWFGLPIERLGLSRRVARLLTDAGVATVEELLRMSVEDLLCMPGIGKTSVRLVRRILRVRVGMDLGDLRRGETTPRLSAARTS